MLQPSYLNLVESNEIEHRIEILYQKYHECDLCPRNCRVNRNDGETGVCSGSTRAKVCSAHPHFGEERPLVGRHGSGTIFFSHCNLLCCYCQNYDISHEGQGREIEDTNLAEIMVGLQKIGCHNINLVTPTHYLPNIVNAIKIAVEHGLRLPIVYNTGGYDNVNVLKILDGIVDIYLPDLKYMEGAISKKYSAGAGDYPEIACKALVEMHRQVGVLKTNKQGLAIQGLMVRHLILPNGIAGTEKFLHFVANHLGTDTYVNIMDQYHPCFRAYEYPELSRRIQYHEYRAALDYAHDCGLYNLD